MNNQYKRILLKLSGESLMGEKQYGIDEKRIAEYATQIKEIADMGIEIGIVIGGGNIFRGLSGTSKGVDRVKGDQMGMLATVINSLALSSALEKIGQKAQVFTAINMFPIGEYYSKWRAIEAMQNGTVAIISGGTGNPFFTTDTRLGPKRYRNRSRSHAERDTCRRYLHGRSRKRSYRKEIRQNQLRRNLYPWIKGHGPHGDHPLQRKPSAHYRIRHGYGRKPEKSIVRREHRDSGILNPVLYGYS